MKNKKRIGALVGAGIVIAIAVGLFSFLRSHALWPVNHYTGMDFTMAKFNEIQPEMSADDVRNRIGLPLSIDHFDSGSSWNYSQPLHLEKPFQKFMVQFDPDSQKVSSRFPCVSRAAQEPKSGMWSDSFPYAPPWTIIRFDLPMIQGQPPSLASDSKTVYVLQVMATWCKPCAKSREHLRKIIQDQFAGSPVQLVLISVDENRQTLENYLQTQKIDLPVAWDPDRSFSKSMNQSAIPHFLILKGQTLYPFNLLHLGGYSEEYYENLTWLIRHIQNAAP